MILKLILKPKEWFEENAYRDPMGWYWENTAACYDRAEAAHAIKSSSLEGGTQYIFENHQKYLWACDEEFVRDKVQYFI